MALPCDLQLDLLIRSAIQKRRLLQLIYKGKTRIVEPHDYGERNHVIQLLTYQIGGESSGPIPAWRLFDIDSLSGVKVLDAEFAGGRPTRSGGHHKWDDLFLRVEPAKSSSNSANSSS